MRRTRKFPGAVAERSPVAAFYGGISFIPSRRENAERKRCSTVWPVASRSKCTTLAKKFPKSAEDEEGNRRALCHRGKQDIRCDTVPDPSIEHPRTGGGVKVVLHPDGNRAAA